MEILTDPKIAPMAWMLPLLAFCWVMFHQLTNNPDSHIWWVGLLSKVKLADKGTTDYEHPVNASKLIFKWLSILAGVLVLYQTFVVVQQYNPGFWGLGPQPLKLTGNEGQPGKLPPRIPGAGGGGKSGTERPSGPTPVGTTPGTEQPGASGAPQGQPGAIQPGVGQPSGIQPGAPAAPAAPGGIQPGIQPGAPGQPGGMQPGAPINPMGGPAGTGGGGQFNPTIR